MKDSTVNRAPRPRLRRTIRRLLATACLLTAIPALADAPFGGEQSIASVAGVNGVAVGDFDGLDGGDVFFTAGGSSEQAVAFRQDDGSWTTQALTPGSGTANLAVGDLDGDGDLDLVYTDFSAGVVDWRENDLDTTGVFLASAQIASGIGGALGLDVADLDGDTDLDVVVAGRTADGYFWADNTAGDASAWTLRTITTGVNAAQQVVAADLDGDGDLDVAGGSASGSGKLAWYENVDGDGLSWVGRDVYSSTIGAVAAGDLDLDGDQDLLVQDATLDEILWWKNTQGDGTAWTAITLTSFPSSRSGLQAVDLDFDGDLDVVGDPDGDWWENIDDASSWTRRSYSDGTDIFDTGVLDVDADGDPDIVAVRNTAGEVAWWANLTCSPGDADDDGDGVRNGCDVCPGSDDTQDADGDLVPDGCDVCPGFDDRVDVNDDDVPDGCEPDASISIDNVTAAEGDAGSTIFTFTVTLSGEADGFTVPYSTQDGTATVAGGDYVAAPGTLTFAGSDGEAQTLDVSVTGDTRVENDDEFLVVLGMPSEGGVALADEIGLGTIANDDTASVSIGNASVLEGDSGTTDLAFTVTLSGDVEDGFEVDVDAEDATATVADDDYVPFSDTLTFAGTDGETKTVTIQVVGDTVVEPDEELDVLVRDPGRPGVTVAAGRGVGSLVNDDEALLAVGDVMQLEGDSGTSDFVFTVTLAGHVAGGFTVPYATSDGSAEEGDDYAAASGILTFSGSDGETRTIDVTILGDTVVESDETFSVELSPSSNPTVVVADGIGAGTILDDDARGTLTVDFEGEGLAVVLSTPPGIDCDPSGGPACTADFATGIDVGLVVGTDVETDFGGFSGDADCTDGSVSFATDAETLTCTAQLSPSQPIFVDGFESGDASMWFQATRRTGATSSRPPGSARATMR